MFPDANIWVIGHSLGGSLASLLGVTFGVPVVTFEPPGERMAARRLHLPTPVRTTFYFRWVNCNRCLAFYAPHHARVEYRRSNCDGHVQWCALKLRIGRICHGEPVCDRYHQPLYRAPPLMHLFRAGQLPPGKHYRIRHSDQSVVVCRCAHTRDCATR